MPFTKFNKKKILLLNPGNFYCSWGKTIKIKPHLVYIYSILKDYFDIEIIDLENELKIPITEEEIKQFKKNALSIILKHEFDIIAISCYTSVNYLPSIYFASKIKKIYPEKIIIVGGYHPSHIPTDFIYENSPFDYVIVGEAENLIENIDKHGDLKITEKKNTTIIQLNKEYPIIKALTPNQISYYKNIKNIDIGLFLSRGCPYKCNFCVEFKNRWSALPVQTAINMVKDVSEKMNPKIIPFYDACFGIDKNWRRKFLSKLIKLNLNNFFWIETRHELFDEEDVNLLSKLKVKICFGIESFSEDMLKIMNKTKNPIAYLDKFLQVNKMLNNKKIIHQVFLIFNHPGETLNTLKQSYNFIKNKLSGIQDSYINIVFQPYSLFPGCEVYNNIDHYSKKYGTRIFFEEWWKKTVDQNILSSRIIPSSDFFENDFQTKQEELIKLINSINKKSQYDTSNLAKLISEIYDKD